MKKGLSLIIIVILCALLYSEEREADSSMQFLKISPSPIGFSLADSYVSTSKNADSMYYNPASTSYIGKRIKLLSQDKNDQYKMNHYTVPFIENINISLNYSKYYESLHYGSLFSTFSTHKIGTFGIGIITYIYDDIAGTKLDSDDQYYYTGKNISLGDYCFLFNYSYRITENIGIGLNLKGIISKLDTYTAESYASDIGLIYHNHTWGSGISVKNLGTSYKFAEEKYNFPLIIHIGGHYNLRFRKILITSQDRLSITSALKKEIDVENIYSIGLEYNLKHYIFLRTAFQVNGNDQGLRAGIGATYKNYQANYAISGYENLGIVHRIGFAINLQSDRQLKYSIKKDNENTSVVIRNTDSFFEDEKLSDKGIEILDEIIDQIEDKDYRRIFIKVYSEDIEIVKENLDRLNNQSKKIADYLIQNGIDQQKVTHKGYNLLVKAEYGVLLKESYSNQKYEIIVIEWKDKEKEKFNHYYYTGMDAFIKQGYKIAINNWDEALKIDPENEYLMKIIAEATSQLKNK